MGKYRKVGLAVLLAGLAAFSIALMRPSQSQSSTKPGVAGIGPQLDGNAALSVAVATTLGVTSSSNSEAALLADVDGREDLVADHAALIVDASSSLTTPGQTLTRVAISEHTIANGFNENIYYYGDSVGNVTVGADTDGDATVESSFVINLPTVLNAFGNLNSGDQIVITGLAVEPVADLTSFANVNGNFASFAGQIGEILYVTFTDNGGGFRLTSNNQIVKSGLLAFPVADIVSAAPSPPGILSPTGFPVQVGGSFGVAFSVFSNLAGVAVDDDGDAYFQQVDLTGKTGANIVEDAPIGANHTRSLATSGFATLTTLNPGGGFYGTASGPSDQVSRITNYSGTALMFGNIVSIAAGPQNALYAAVARSFSKKDKQVAQNLEGPFSNNLTVGATPSMIISFSDTIGGTNTCFPGLPAPDGIADANPKGVAVNPGVNNFRTFVEGSGPDRRNSVFPAFGTTANTLQMSFQIDYSIYGGITVDEEGKVYVISGGSPAGVGRNPSPNLGEILVFPDDTPYDRRADYVDLRGETIPNPTVTSGNVGNGKSDRFDHIFWQAPIDSTTQTPVGIAGLTRGFLLYTSRTRPTTETSLDLLPNGGTQLANSTVGPINFEDFDASHQVAGGDDQTFPFRGDDDDGGGSPALWGPLKGGFEFIFNTDTDGDCVPAAWNAFYLNSNGSVSFGAGDTNYTPNIGDFMSGPPKIAPAWAALDTDSRYYGPHDLSTFPVQAMGFANINHFIVKWIDVPQPSEESCGEVLSSSKTASGLISVETAADSNSFAVSLYDDGTGKDENANQPLNPANPIGNNEVPFDLQEGPTDLRFHTVKPFDFVGAPPRPDGSGYFTFHYARMDLIGTSSAPVLTGFSIGNQSPTPPNLCTTTNLSKLPNQQLIGNNKQATIFEFFSTGSDGPPPVPDFDLRARGSNPNATTPKGQANKNQDTLDFTGVACGQPLTFNCP